MTRIKLFQAALCAAFCVLAICSNCIAAEPSKYRKECGEWVFAHALPGTSSTLFSRLVDQCVNAREYEEKQAKERASDREFRDVHSLVQAQGRLIELANGLPKEAKADCDSKVNKQSPMAEIMEKYGACIRSKYAEIQAQGQTELPLKEQMRIQEEATPKAKEQCLATLQEKRSERMADYISCLKEKREVR